MKYVETAFILPIPDAVLEDAPNFADALLRMIRADLRGERVCFACDAEFAKERWPSHWRTARHRRAIA